MRLGSAVQGVVLIGLLGGGAYIYQDQLRGLVQEAQRMVLPCSTPVTYRIGSIDPKFGISQATVTKDLSVAAGLWNTAAGKSVIAYDEAHGAVTVDLVYDSRQDMTKRLKVLGITLSDDRTSYDQVKKKYDAIHAEFASKKAAFESDLASFKADNAAYESKVKYWNDKGGAPASEYASITAQRQSLSARSQALQQEQDGVNALVGEVNDLANALNQLIDSLKLDVQKYNSTGASNGTSFEEGLYVRSGIHETITIYEYENNALLTRVLAHELGHALDLEHVDDPDAIMYYLNQGSAIALTKADRTELARVCRGL